MRELMKSKLLIFTIVLVTASISSALIDLNISVTLDPFGTPEYIESPADSEITINPSDYLYIGIHGSFISYESASVWLVAQGPATLSGGSLLVGDGTHIELDPAAAIDPDEDPDYTWGDFFDDYLGYPGVQPMISQIEFMDTSDVLPYTIMGILFNEKLFYCTGTEDVTLTLIRFDDESWAVYDQLIIHQPEPMTIALLGLGGLFLRRRK